MFSLYSNSDLRNLSVFASPVLARRRRNVYSEPNQYWMLSKTGEIRRDEACLDYAGSDVILYPCHGSKGNQYWQYDHYSSTLRHGASRKCLTISVKKDKLQMEECGKDNPRQRWK